MKSLSLPGERIGYLVVNPECPGAAEAADMLVVPGGTFGWPGHVRIAYCTDDRTADLAVARLTRGNAS